MTYTGIIQIRLDNVGSKNEGRFAHLVTESGEDYLLYRQDVYPADDPYFTEYDNQTVEVEGTKEEYTPYILVEHVERMEQ